jgi:hypothetical protein
MTDLQTRIELEALITERDSLSCTVKAMQLRDADVMPTGGLTYSENEYNLNTLKLEAIAAKMRALNEPGPKQTDNVERLMKAINWLMGCNGNYETPPNAERYWYRSALARRAGLVYDSEKLVYVIGAPKDEAKK